MTTGAFRGSGLVLWPRGTLARFVEAHELAWDLTMGALTVLYVVLAFTEDSPFGWQEYAVWGLAGVFLLEFGARYYDSWDRSAYLRTHWLDLITAIPVPGIPGLRLIRLIRLLRFAKIGVLFRREMLGRGWSGTHLVWPTLVLFWIGSALALWLVEHDAPGTSIVTFPDAMTAAFLTAATLGFGRHGLPVTQDGQIIAAAIVFFALGLWGFASSNLTRMWLEAREDLSNPEMQFLVEKVEELRDQVRQLTEALTQRQVVLADFDRQEPTDDTGEPVIAVQAASSPN